MGIQIISISHKIAPLSIREKFAFSKEEQIHLTQAILEHEEIRECVLLATCNRTELYVYADSDARSVVFGKMEETLLKEADCEQEEEMGNYLLFYHGKKAIHHLFLVAAGLDSMVIGEDQILGQVKNAHQQALEAGTTGVYLNTFFRLAVTSAKKVKTETDLSKTSVSTATLTLKVSEERLGTLKGKKVMVIGASGKIGGIVLMNLQSLGGVDIYVTTRQTKPICIKHGKAMFTEIDYEDRYAYLDDMDVIISATSSPHYTLTYHKMKSHIKTEKKRVFVDLAVPMDIEEKIAGYGESYYYNIDDFDRIAEENNKKKLKEAENAGSILDEYELEFEQWLVFQKNRPLMNKVRDNFLKVADAKGVEKAFDHLFYWVRENNDPEDLQAFFRCLDN